MPTPLATEGVKTGDADGLTAPKVSAPSTEDAPPPVLILGDEAGVMAPPPPAVAPPATPTPEPAPQAAAPTAEPTAAPTSVPTAEPTMAAKAPAEAPPPPMVSVPVESEAPAAPVINSGAGYEQIGGKAEPPAWFFTPEAGAPPKDSSVEAPVIVVQADTPTPEPTLTPQPTPAPTVAAEAPAAPAIQVEAPSAPAIAVEAPAAPAIHPEPEAPVVAPAPPILAAPAPEAPAEPVAETIKIAKPKPGNDILSDTVEAEMKHAPKNNPDEAFSVALLLGRGKELEAKGRYYESWRTYRDIVREHPNDLRGWGAMNSFYARRLTERARFLEKQKRYFEAANLYRDIVTRDASVASAWWGLGTIFYKYHKKEQALYCYDRVLKLKPKMKEFKNWVGEYRQGK